LAITTRKRVLPYQGSRSSGLTSSFNSPRPGVSHSETVDVINSTAFKSFDGIQITVSENHPLWKYHSRGTFKGDLGGEFSSKKQYVLGGNPGAVSLVGVDAPNPDRSFNSVNYSGPWLPLDPRQCQFPAYADSSDSDLRALGTTAIALASPVNPTSNVTTFLSEFFQDGIPHMVGSVLRGLSDLKPSTIAKAFGGEHLNIQFGWAPFVSDLKHMFHSVRNASEILDQLDRDSGKVVRRGWKFKPDISNSIAQVTGNQGPWTLQYSSLLYDQFKDPKSVVMRETKVERYRWFSGAYVYYVPPESLNGLTTDAVARKILQAERVLGVAPTPDAVWNLLPWSWLVDWFSNTGDLLDNLRNWILYNQVLKYGYMMEHTISTNTYTLVGDYYLRNGLPGPPPPSVSLVSETKRRIKATPYGFGVTYDGLSAMQKSILAALGLTHGLK
jgi:hypothetical protein